MTYDSKFCISLGGVKDPNSFLATSEFLGASSYCLVADKIGADELLCIFKMENQMDETSKNVYNRIVEYFDTHQIKEIVKPGFSVPELRDPRTLHWIRTYCSKGLLPEIKNLTDKDQRIGHTIWADYDWLYSKITVPPTQVLDDVTKEFWKILNQRGKDSFRSYSVYSEIVERPLII